MTSQRFEENYLYDVIKEEILEKVVEIAEREGWEKTSIRKISKEIGYSTIKIYSDFGGKEGLLKEIQAKGFKELKKVYCDSVVSTDLTTNLTNLTVAHLRFAKNNSQLYDLMFSLNGAVSSFPDGELLKETGQPIREILYKIDGELLKHRFYHWWSIAHGYFSVTQSNPFMSIDEVEEILIKIIKDFSQKRNLGIE